MITAILGGVILSTFGIMFYIEDRMGGGLMILTLLHPFATVTENDTFRSQLYW